MCNPCVVCVVRVLHVCVCVCVCVSVCVCVCVLCVLSLVMVWELRLCPLFMQFGGMNSQEYLLYTHNWFCMWVLYQRNINNIWPHFTKVWLKCWIWMLIKKCLNYSNCKQKSILYSINIVGGYDSIWLRGSLLSYFWPSLVGKELRVNGLLSHWCSL